MSSNVISGDELESLIAYVSKRYRDSGQPADVVEALDHHNNRVLSHVDEIAKGEGVSSEEHLLLRTIAILHDAAKADTHLMLHAEAGADIAEQKLRELGKSDDFIAAIQRGIRCHMGPFPFIEEEAKKYAARTGDHLHFPRPASLVDRLFYDADMLALMDIEGIEKVVVLRSTTPEFIEEDDRTTKIAGGTRRAAAYRSALKSVQRACDSLHCATARTIARHLMDEAEEHISSRLIHEDGSQKRQPERDPAT